MLVLQARASAFLTGPGGLPRPIELHAHDPIRYVGDMLAWVHQSIAAEREFLGAVFGRGEEGAGRMVGSVRRFSKAEAGEDEEEWIRELVDIGVDRLVAPLKNRVLQTLRPSCTKAGEKQKAGLGSEFGEVLDVAIDPVVESVIKGGEEKDKLRPRWNASVWIVNCLTYILSVVEPFSSFTQEKQDGIKTLLDTRVAALIEEHTTSLLDESGLFGVYQTIEHPPNTSEPLSHFRETNGRNCQD
ncbi:hypothetical protein D9611_008602 [Ephemerocybe angulata]|uniref:Conserved Oligomeric Golgi complex subunit 6 C-terminal domain-containing protein n=2 Tax=Ephemerocybe angulata TaxID=980116 RepID=A0A8H5EUT5_9AGAR|nr:hypothetical protein D9611_008602 [Tulosesus angulatus]